MSMNDLLTTKQQEVLHSYLADDYKMMILTGAIRSGKTFIDNLLFLYELRRTAESAKKRGKIHPQYILAGASSGSIQNNVINSLRNQFGIELSPDRHNHFHLYGVDIIPVYTQSIRGLSGARGFDSNGAYINEASLANQFVFQEILNRCSEPGARIICDTNPDQPQHFLKTDYIDNEKPGLKTKSFRFTIDDNTFLAPDYIQQIKAATPTGMFYDRNILGLWVSGDGLVYRDFDKTKMMIDKLPPNRTYKYYCGVDFGFAEGHDTSITVWADDRQGNTYLVEEHTAIHKYIDYWIEVMKQIQQRYGKGLTFWCDSARPEYVSQLMVNGIQARNADKNVLTGIESVAELMTTRSFFVLKSAPVKFIDEIYQYVWDSDKGVPVKKMDNCMDSMRYAIFNEHKDNQTQFLNSKYF